MHHRELIRTGQCGKQPRPIPQAYKRNRQKRPGLFHEIGGLAWPVQGGGDKAPEHAARVRGALDHVGALRGRRSKIFLKEHGIAVGARVHFAADVVRGVVMVGRKFARIVVDDAGRRYQRNRKAALMQPRGKEGWRKLPVFWLERTGGFEQIPADCEGGTVKAAPCGRGGPQALYLAEPSLHQPGGTMVFEIFRF